MYYKYVRAMSRVRRGNSLQYVIVRVLRVCTRAFLRNLEGKLLPAFARERDRVYYFFPLSFSLASACGDFFQGSYNWHYVSNA